MPPLGKFFSHFVTKEWWGRYFSLWRKWAWHMAIFYPPPPNPLQYSKYCPFSPMSVQWYIRNHLGTENPGLYCNFYMCSFLDCAGGETRWPWKFLLTLWLYDSVKAYSTWTVALGIHARAINIFSFNLKPAKNTSRNVAVIRTTNPIHSVATQSPAVEKNTLLTATKSALPNFVIWQSKQTCPSPWTSYPFFNSYCSDTASAAWTHSLYVKHFLQKQTSLL